MKNSDPLGSNSTVVDRSRKNNTVVYHLPSYSSLFLLWLKWENISVGKVYIPTSGVPDGGKFLRWRTMTVLSLT